MSGPRTRAEVSDDLRRQADACRNLSRRASTLDGAEALSKFADMLEADARRSDTAGGINLTRNATR